MGSKKTSPPKAPLSNTVQEALEPALARFAIEAALSGRHWSAAQRGALAGFKLECHSHARELMGSAKARAAVEFLIAKQAAADGELDPASAALSAMGALQGSSALAKALAPLTVRWEERAAQAMADAAQAALAQQREAEISTMRALAKKHGFACARFVR